MRKLTFVFHLCAYIFFPVKVSKLKAWHKRISVMWRNETVSEQRECLSSDFRLLLLGFRYWALPAAGDAKTNIRSTKQYVSLFDSFHGEF